jgi:hypothetical protein
MRVEAMNWLDLAWVSKDVRTFGVLIEERHPDVRPFDAVDAAMRAAAGHRAHTRGV